jgi:murein L,D-transpeptidase YcbB/YkuD
MPNDVIARGQPSRPTRGPVAWVSLALAAAITLAGCGGGSSDNQVRVAEAKVSAKQRALSEAQSAFEAASTAFCHSATTYITSLDRYGDLLNATAPTVGDVRTAGSDLAAPRQDAATAARKAVDAHQAVAEAQNELADAKAALKQAKNGTTTPSPAGGGSSAPSSATPTPLVPAATLNRVKSAESQFQAALKGVTDQTPLTRASQEFNAAAVAVEMSWLRLFADAGCLTSEQQQQAEAAVRDYTTTLQQSLTEAGYYHDTIDGVYGPTTVEAVKALQHAHGLPVTGTVDKATEAALQADLQKAGGAAAQDAVASTAAVQQTLKLAGYWDGPVDGNWTPALTEALKKFQEHLGVQPSGTVDAATVAALDKAIATAPAPSPAPSASSSGSSTASETATPTS